MRGRDLARYAPLTGIGFVVAVVLAFIIGGNTPDNDDSLASIVKYWHDNDTAQIWVSVIGAWGTLFFVWFAASLRAVLRPVEEGPSRLSAINFAGAIIAATGLLSALSINFAVADTVGDIPPRATQTLTILNNEFFLPIAAGFALFYIAAGALAIRTRVLPVWLGWLTLVLGIACVTPLGFFAIMLGLIWILGVSIVLYMRGSRAAAAAPGTPVAPAAA